ncbi:hypothetical protein MVEN_02157100 [Mycena venus]|uniref:Uncharacterized protein n=1 Tax=Mycena venus TaxID=2733690 RepID=A0A8H7CH32_9AGAR|nr:hypothetical protein MVEN_02157100 [Mycena venus]
MLFAISVNSTVLFLYALYVVLFFLSLRILRRYRIPSVRAKFFMGTAWLMFLLATAGTVLVISTAGISMRMVHLLVKGDNDTSEHLLRLYHSLSLGQDIILAVNNLVTDLLFLYRWSMIWRSEKRILVVPATMILSTVVVGCISGLGYYRLISLNVYIDPKAPFLIGGATNIVLMCLTAGRIWYIRREVEALTGQSLQKRYDTAVAIMSVDLLAGFAPPLTHSHRLESGFLYGLCVIMYVISISIHQSSPFGTIFSGVAWGLLQLGINIVPMLILVRVGMGRSTENTLPALSLNSHTPDQHAIFPSNPRGGQSLPEKITGEGR